MKQSTRIWLTSLIAAAIGGAANSGGTYVSGLTIAPDVFGSSEGLTILIKMSIANAALGAVGAVLATLKKSPLPGVKAPE